LQLSVTVHFLREVYINAREIANIADTPIQQYRWYHFGSAADARAAFLTEVCSSSPSFNNERHVTDVGFRLFLRALNPALDEASATLAQGLIFNLFAEPGDLMNVANAFAGFNQAPPAVQASLRWFYEIIASRSNPTFYIYNHSEVTYTRCSFNSTFTTVLEALPTYIHSSKSMPLTMEGSYSQLAYVEPSPNNAAWTVCSPLQLSGTYLAMAFVCQFQQHHFRIIQTPEMPAFMSSPCTYDPGTARRHWIAQNIIIKSH
jgi:hypothetical protein